MQSVIFRKGAKESILTINITNWPGLCTAQDIKALQQVVKSTENIIGIHLLSIDDICEVRCLHGAQRNPKRGRPPCSPCCHLTNDTYLLLYHQITDQLPSSLNAIVFFLYFCVAQIWVPWYCWLLCSIAMSVYYHSNAKRYASIGKPTVKVIYTVGLSALPRGTNFSMSGQLFCNVQFAICFGICRMMLCSASGQLTLTLSP